MSRHSSAVIIGGSFLEAAQRPCQVLRELMGTVEVRPLLRVEVLEAVKKGFGVVHRALPDDPLERLDVGDELLPLVGAHGYPSIFWLISVQASRRWVCSPGSIS